jgi:hypothetical protein
VKIGRFARQLEYSVAAALALLFLCPAAALAQGHDDAMAMQSQPQTPASKDKATALVKAVRDATERFRDVTVAEQPSEGPYELRFGCVSGGDFGAMGVHFVNFALVGDGVIDVTKPELLVYEPAKNGHLNLVAADYLVDAAQWNASHDAPPELGGQLFHLFDAPNRFNLPAFYTLHVWAWKDNPNGTFTNWNPNVSCDGFIPR